MTTEKTENDGKQTEITGTEDSSTETVDVDETVEDTSEDDSSDSEEESIEAAPKPSRQQKAADTKKRRTDRRRQLSTDDDVKTLIAKARAEAKEEAAEEAKTLADRGKMEEIDRVRAEKADSDSKVVALEAKLAETVAKQEYASAVSDLDVAFAKGAKKALRHLVADARGEDAELSVDEAIDQVLVDNPYLLKVESESPQKTTDETAVESKSRSRRSTVPSRKKDSSSKDPPNSPRKDASQMSKQEVVEALAAHGVQMMN